MPVSETYWLPGFELSRKIVIEQIKYMLGPSASARQYSHQGSDGFLIEGPRLTDVSSWDIRDTTFQADKTQAQITDLKRQSREHERQRARRMQGRASSNSGQEEPDINHPVTLRPGRRSPNNGSGRDRHHR